MILVRLLNIIYTIHKEPVFKSAGIWRALKTWWTMELKGQTTDLDDSSNTEIIYFLKRLSEKIPGPFHMNLERSERPESHRL